MAGEHTVSAGGELGHMIEMSSMDGSEDPSMYYGVFITFLQGFVVKGCNIQ